MTEDWQGFRCICGGLVVTVHKDCEALMGAQEFSDWMEKLGGR